MVRTGAYTDIFKNPPGDSLAAYSSETLPLLPALGFLSVPKAAQQIPSFQGEASGCCSLLFTPHPFGKSVCVSQEAGLQIMVGSVTVNPAPTGFRQIQWQPLSFKAVYSGMATICWAFPCYTESSPKSLSQLPALGKQASKRLVLGGGGVQSRWVSRMLYI